MIKFSSFILIIFTPFLILSQGEIYEKNIWTSLVVRTNLSNKCNFTFDIGYRTFDDFVKLRRQVLIRGIMDYKIRENQSMGLGFAYFESISSNLVDYKTEMRPFFQYFYANKKNKSDFSLRFRNEIRGFVDDEKIVNRFRLQLSFEYKFHKFISPRLSIEEFLTLQNSNILEQRYGFSNTLYFSDVINLNVFYILQFQSSIKNNVMLIPQNILGLQLVINI
jgi:hypothetical protein